MHGGPCVSPTPQPNGRVVFGVGHRQPLALLSVRHNNNLDGWDFRSPRPYDPIKARPLTYSPI